MLESVRRKRHQVCRKKPQHSRVRGAFGVGILSAAVPSCSLPLAVPSLQALYSSFQSSDVFPVTWRGDPRHTPPEPPAGREVTDHCFPILLVPTSPVTASIRQVDYLRVRRQSPSVWSYLPSRLNCPAKCCYTPAHMEHRDDQRFCAKRPSLGSILLGLIPFTAACFSVSLWDRVHPMVLGLPFNFFWLISWLLLTPLCMWGAYWLETRRASKSHRKEGGTL